MIFKENAMTKQNDNSWVRPDILAETEKPKPAEQVKIKKEKVDE